MRIINDLPSYSLDRLDGVQTGLCEKFFEPLHSAFRSELSHHNLSDEVRPLIDIDNFGNSIESILSTLTDNEERRLRLIGYDQKGISPNEWGKNTIYKALIVFLDKYTEFSNVLLNCHLPASIAIKAASWHMDEDISATNFVSAKKLTSKFNSERWTRDQNLSERQSGVSNLGAISEGLLEIALESIIDDENFFWFSRCIKRGCLLLRFNC